MDLISIKARNAGILDALRNGEQELPSPSGVALELMRMVERRDVGVFEVCRIARADPVLVAKSIQMANSALYGGLRQTAAMEDAVMRIGVASLARLAVGLSLVDGVKAWRGAYDLRRSWRRALARALVLQQLARRMRNLPSSEAFSLGLLCDIGELGMVAAFGEGVLERGGDSGDLLAQQREAHGFDQNQASAAMLDGWGFPPSLWLATLPPSRDIAHAAGRSADLAQMVEVARGLPDALSDPSSRELPCMVLGAARLGLDGAAIVELIDQLRADFDAMARILEIAGTDEDVQAQTGRLREVLAAVPPAEAGPGVVLLVAPPAPATEAMRRALQDAGQRVIAATSATQGLDQLRQARPDVLVLDADLPGLDALGLCRQLRADCGARLYLLLVSVDPGADAVLAAIDAGANDVLRKPVEHKLLVAKSLLGGRTVRLISLLERERENAFGMQRELVKVNANLRAAAYTDELTGLPNRRALDDFLRKSWSEALRSGRPLSCVVMDIDHFKRVNDSYGHEVGDHVLCGVSRVLQAQTRSTDLLARWGGEELVLVCPGADLPTVAAIAERMRLAVEHLKGTLPSVTVSAGIAQAVTDGDGVGEMLRQADSALLRAKQAGRNRVAAADGAQDKARA